MGYTAAQQEHEIKVEFRYALSESTLDWMESRLINYKDVDAAIQALEEFVLETTNPYQIYLECAKHNQGEHDTIDDLNMFVRERVKNMTTQFKSVADAIEWQHKVFFLTALKSDKTRKKLIEEGKNKDYAAWVEVAKTDELVEEKNVQLLSTKSSTQIHHVSAYQASRGCGSGRGGRGRHGIGEVKQQQCGWSHAREHNQHDRLTSRSRSNACGYCGREKHDLEKCPARDKECFQCQRRGHFAQVCRNTVFHAKDKPTWQQKSGMDTRVSSITATAEVPLMAETGNVEHQNLLSTGRWPLEALDCIRVTLSTKEGKSRTIDMLPDTGANINLIRLDDARKIWPDNMVNQMLPSLPRQVSGQPLDIHGYIDADLYAEDVDGQLRHLKDVRFIVSKDTTRALLSRSICKALGLISNNFPQKFEANSIKEVSNIAVPAQAKVGHREMLDNIVTRHPEVSGGKIKGMAGGPCRIKHASDGVPTHHQYLPQYKTADEKKFQEMKLTPATNHGRGTPHPLLPPGTKVFIQDRKTKRWTMVGEIISKGKNEREYMVRDHNGRTLHTNSRFVKQRHDSAQIALPTGNVKAQMPTPRTTRSAQMMPTGMPEPRPIHERKLRVRFTVEDENDRQRAMRRPMSKYRQPKQSLPRQFLTRKRKKEKGDDNT
jgi:hypothetical protein